MASNAPLATNRRLSSFESAIACGTAPPSIFVLETRLVVPSSRSTETTESALLKATYSEIAWGLSAIAVGCELGAIGSDGFARSIQRVTLPVSRFSSATADAFHRLTQALVPALLAITVYG